MDRETREDRLYLNANKDERSSLRLGGLQREEGGKREIRCVGSCFAVDANAPHDAAEGRVVRCGKGAHC